MGFLEDELSGMDPTLSTSLSSNDKDVNKAKEAAQKICDHAGHFIAKQGNLATMVQKFELEGIGGIIGSWVSPGENAPISPEQMSQVVGEKEITKISKKIGLSEHETAQGIAKVMPVIVDKMTSDGKIPSADQTLTLVRQVVDAIKGNFV